MRYAMVIDTRKCIGCCDCVVACQTENKVPVGFCRDWIVQEVRGKYPKINIEYRSERCNHCDNAPCVRTCPTGASHIREGGIVGVKEKKCIGCSACIQSCPYDARFTHTDGYVDKCTFCYKRVENNELPACVSTCPTRCMHFGDLDNPQSMVSQLLVKRKYKTLKPETGTSPQVYYLI